MGIHKEKDIAILEFDSETSPCEKPLFPGYDELSISVGLICVGYTPSKGDNTLTVSLAKKYIKEVRLRDTEETILEFENGEIEGGCSGGPIMGNGGVVLGIMINLFSDVDSENKVLVRATSIANVMEAIEIEFNKSILRPRHSKD